MAAKRPETERTQGIDIVRQAGYDIHTEAPLLPGIENILKTRCLSEHLMAQ